MSELKTKKPTVKYILQSYGTILALALIIILFSIISPTSFFTLTNFKDCPLLCALSSRSLSAL